AGPRCFGWAMVLGVVHAHGLRGGGGQLVSADTAIVVAAGERAPRLTTLRLPAGIGWVGLRQPIAPPGTGLKLACARRLRPARARPRHSKSERADAVAVAATELGV